MGKLKNSALEYISEHMVECRKHNSAKRRLVFIADSSAAAAAIIPWLKTAWGATKITDNEDNVRVLLFDTVGERDKAVQEINAEVAAYRYAHPDSIVPKEAVINTTDVTNTTAEPDEPTKETPDWTTYILIGLAAMAIVLLIWPKKKK